MNLSMLFWVIMIVWLLFGLWSSWPAAGGTNGFRGIGGHILVWVLLAILGWQVFGAAIHK